MNHNDYMDPRMLILSLCLSLFAFIAKASTGVQICNRSVTLYALYEGSHHSLHNIKVWTENRSLSRDNYLRMALNHIQNDQPSIYGYIEEKLNIILPNLSRSMVSRLPPHQNSTDVVFLEPTCRYVTASVWPNEAAKPSIDKAIFRSLSPMGQAALLIQQSMSKFVNEVEINSLTPNFASQWTAKVFSNESLKPKGSPEGMSQEDKINLSKTRYCTPALDSLSKQIKLYVDVAVSCSRDKSPERLSIYHQLKNLINTTIDECERDCLWDEGVRVCREFIETINMATACESGP